MAGVNDDARSGASISVTRMGEGTYRVEVDEQGAGTTHLVDVAAGLADELGWGERGEADLVRASFEFLLDREPARSILGRFGLEVIARYFPEYPAEMRARSGGSGPASG